MFYCFFCQVYFFCPFHLMLESYFVMFVFLSQVFYVLGVTGTRELRRSAETTHPRENSADKRHKPRLAKLLHAGTRAGTRARARPGASSQRPAMGGRACCGLGRAA